MNQVSRWSAFLVAIAMVISGRLSCGQTPSNSSQSSDFVLLKTTKGDIVLELDPAKSPTTVANFLAYVDEKFYDGTIFHRILRHRFVQGGAYTANMQWKRPSHAPIRNESSNGLKHVRGAIALASSTVPDSGACEFFIDTMDNRSLDAAPPGNGFAVFGHVVAGMDVVDEIQRQPLISNIQGEESQPDTAVVITHARRLAPEEARSKVEHVQRSSAPATSAGTADQSAKPALSYVIMVTSKGEIVLELNHEKAPFTVDNFLSYVDKRFYDGLIFHRVVRREPGKGLDIIQGGGLDADMQRKTAGLAAPIKNEWTNGLKNQRGAISMARSNGQPDSATSQFYINADDNPSLDIAGDGAAYAVFGRVVAGMTAVQNILLVHTADKGDYHDVPESPIVIQSITRISPDEAIKRIDQETAQMRN